MRRKKIYAKVYANHLTQNPMSKRFFFCLNRIMKQQMELYKVNAMKSTISNQHKPVFSLSLL